MVLLFDMKYAPFTKRARYRSTLHVVRRVIAHNLSGSQEQRVVSLASISCSHDR